MSISPPKTRTAQVDYKASLQYYLHKTPNTSTHPGQAAAGENVRIKNDETFHLEKA